MDSLVFLARLLSTLIVRLLKQELEWNPINATQVCLLRGLQASEVEPHMVLKSCIPNNSASMRASWAAVSYVVTREADIGPLSAGTIAGLCHRRPTRWAIVRRCRMNGQNVARLLLFEDLRRDGVAPLEHVGTRFW